MFTTDRSIFTSEIGIADTTVDRPVVYLDQNHWIDLVRQVAFVGARPWPVGAQMSL